jgi:hypothetical protein
MSKNVNMARKDLALFTLEELRREVALRATSVHATKPGEPPLFIRVEDADLLIGTHRVSGDDLYTLRNLVEEAIG